MCMCQFIAYFVIVFETVFRAPISWRVLFLPPVPQKKKKNSHQI